MEMLLWPFRCRQHKYLRLSYILRITQHSTIFSVWIISQLTGDPKPIVTWNRDNGNLPEGRSRVLLDNTLRIEDARPEDQGQYICKAHNEGGNVSVAVKLYVYGKKKRTSIRIRYKSYYNRMPLPSENVCLCVSRVLLER